jgi:endonuclease G
MKKLFLFPIVFFIAVVCFNFAFQTGAQNADDADLVSPHIVISQFQVAGGVHDDEFIELHNTSSQSVDLNGYRLVYRSSSGTNDVLFAQWTTSTVIPPGGYYLIVSSNYDGSVPGDYTYNLSTCACALSGSSGGLAVRQGGNNTGVVIDSVGWGGATNIFVEAATTGAPPANAGQARKSDGCQDTDNNQADFSTLNPAAPRNSASAPVICSGGGGTQILASGAASPSTVAPGGTTLLTVTVFPATTPPSTDIAVSGDLTNIGGPAQQQFFDDGTNGDTTAGDNVFSYLATIPADLPGGQVSVPAVASDAQSRTANVSINLTIDAPLPGEDPLLLGNPSNATPDPANENNYLMVKPQYTLSYNRSRATANWVAWRLDSSWIGSAPRQDDFRPDPTLPAGWYQVTGTDYSGSGYDRGHMVPSADRTRSVADNSATFLMTNIVPQLSANNQGPWNDFEMYLRTVAQSGNEIYIVSGVLGNAGTIAQGRVVVPQYTWKVALVLPNGNNDLARVNKQTRTIAILVPNQPPVNQSAPWRNFRKTVDQIEALTGYDFFSAVPKNTQEIIERRMDTQ